MIVCDRCGCGEKAITAHIVVSRELLQFSAKTDRGWKPDLCGDCLEAVKAAVDVALQPISRAARKEP